MEGVGLELTDEIRVTIAAQACLLLLNLDYPCYPTLRRVLVYPGVFQPRRVELTHFGDIVQEPRPTLGEAWTSGVVVLSWDSSLAGALNPEEGQNVVLHEFAHVLDGENGAMDGLPLFDRPSAYRTWSDVFRLAVRAAGAGDAGGEGAAGASVRRDQRGGVLRGGHGGVLHDAGAVQGEAPGSVRAS